MINERKKEVNTFSCSWANASTSRRADKPTIFIRCEDVSKKTGIQSQTDTKVSRDKEKKNREAERKEIRRKRRKEPREIVEIGADGVSEPLCSLFL